MARRRGMGGLAELRRAMRSLPAAAKDEIASELRSAGFDVVSAMKARAPRKTGKVAAALTYRIMNKGLKMRAGLLEETPGANTLFYGRIQDLGRKAQSVRVRRRKKRGGTASYILRVRHMEGKRFVTSRYATLRARVERNLQAVGDRIARRMGLK